MFPVQLTMCRIGNLTRLINSYSCHMCDHTFHPSCGSPDYALRLFIAMEEVQHSYNSSTSLMVEFYLTSCLKKNQLSRFPLQKERKNENSGNKNRTHDFRTSRCAGYLLYDQGDNMVMANGTENSGKITCLDRTKNRRNENKKGTQTVCCLKLIEVCVGRFVNLS